MKKHKFKKSLGQNFLNDNNISEKIVELVNVNENSLILEVGPGSGVLTEKLSAKARVLAYEIDQDLKAALEKRFAGKEVSFIYGDFLKRDLAKDLESFNYENIYFVANLPYYITTAIIQKIIDSKLSFNKIVIMVQKEVAERFTAKSSTKDYSSITVYLNYHYDIKKEFLVGRNSFYPRPNVDSMVISFSPKPKQRKAKSEEHFYKLVRDSFTHKRKNLKNNLGDYDLELISNYLLTKNMDLTIRAEQLSLDDFINISDILSSI